jgi:hypothetical protein
MNNSITLLNFEGPVLWAKCVNSADIAIYDQWNELVDLLTIEEFYSFIDGELKITDSRERNWIYTEQSNEARPKISRLFKFLNQFQFYSAHDV